MLNARLQRAYLLMQQERYELAENEARGALAEDPDGAEGHAILGLILACRDQLDAAEKEAQQAVGLAPDDPFCHYVMGIVLLDRNRLEEAAQSAQEAIRLEPDPSVFGLLARVRFQQGDWNGSLEAADRGLELEPEHKACVHARGMALMQLGRKDEAHEVLSAALGRDPENPAAHTARGWVYLDQGDQLKALESFREALRLDPTSESARAGIVEALKARHKIYGLFLRYMLWMGKLSRGKQWAIVLAAYFGYRFLGNLVESNPEWAPVIYPLIGIYLFLVILNWTADSMFNLLLRLNRFGRLSLSDEQRRSSTLFGVCLALCLGSLITWLITGQDAASTAAIVFGVMIFPVTGSFACPKGWPRMVMFGLTGLMLFVGLWVIAFDVLYVVYEQKAFKALSNLILFPFVLGAIATPWLVNGLLMVQVKR